MRTKKILIITFIFSLIAFISGTSLKYVLADNLYSSYNSSVIQEYADNTRQSNEDIYNYVYPLNFSTPGVTTPRNMQASVLSSINSYFGSFYNALSSLEPFLYPDINSFNGVDSFILYSRTNIVYNGLGSFKQFVVVPDSAFSTYRFVFVKSNSSDSSYNKLVFQQLTGSSKIYLISFGIYKDYSVGYVFNGADDNRIYSVNTGDVFDTSVLSSVPSNTDYIFASSVPIYYNDTFSNVYDSTSLQNSVLTFGDPHLMSKNYLFVPVEPEDNTTISNIRLTSCDIKLVPNDDISSSDTFIRGDKVQITWTTSDMVNYDDFDMYIDYNIATSVNSSTLGHNMGSGNGDVKFYFRYSLNVTDYLNEQELVDTIYDLSSDLNCINSTPESYKNKYNNLNKLFGSVSDSELRTGGFVLRVTVYFVDKKGATSKAFEKQFNLVLDESEIIDNGLISGDPSGDSIIDGGGGDVFGSSSNATGGNANAIVNNNQNITITDGSDELWKDRNGKGSFMDRFLSDFENLIGSIDTDSGTVNGGLLGFFGDVFSYLPDELWNIIIFTVSVSSVLGIIHFIRKW